MKNLHRAFIALGTVLFWGLWSLTLAQVMTSRNSANNNVPDYYYSNYKFRDDWDAITEWFTKAQAKFSLGQEVSSSEFSELSKHFDKVFPNLTQDFSATYEKCSLLAKTLANDYSRSNMEALMWNTCYRTLMNHIGTINSSYRVKPSINLSATAWMAPLTVTFDARGSSDPSMETIPTNNFYWYYRDEKWVDRPIWEWQVLSYTFKESGKFIVHMTARSSNVDQWILDGESNMTINVTPKAADIVVYANTRRLDSKPLKMGISEWEKWVVFDWSLTVPRWWRKILKHKWTIVNEEANFYSDTKFVNGTPGYINVPLKWKWLFTITLTTLDNENNSVSENFYIYLSDPVTIIKQTPEAWTTSTVFNFDGSASYSITNRLSSYVWEVFDNNWGSENGTKIGQMVQWKSMNLNWNKKIKPGNYTVKLTVTDMKWNQNVETKSFYVESTKPTPQFKVVSTTKRQYPSEFILDASSTTDVDVSNWVDSLEYKRSFSTQNYKIISTENNNKKIVVQFNEKWRHLIKLTVTDQYGKFASVSRYVDVNSTLRPEIEANPQATNWWSGVHFKGTIDSNRKIWDYARDFWDWTISHNGENLSEIEHKYAHRGIYSVRLTVRDQYDDMNTVLEKVFIWEVDKPIAAYQVFDSNWYKIQSTDTCRIKNAEGNYDKEPAFSVDRYAKFTINPAISTNTKWTANLLRYIFTKEPIAWAGKLVEANPFTATFSEVGCHYVDLKVSDENVWKQANERIRFNVKNAKPTIRNITLTFPQYATEENPTMFWFTADTDSNKSIFDCTWNSNLTIKVTAVEPNDPDWNVSRLRFYYYNVDDPSRILEYKESWISAPYVFFVIPKIAWEYKFWVMVYDNDGWMIDSKNYLASNPSVYFPAACGDADVPTVTLKVGSTNIQVWDEVTYSIVSRIAAENEDFQTERTFYYDFTWDWKWDLVTKKDTATYTFNEPFEEWVTPRGWVEYRWKFGQTDWATIVVKNGIKPYLEYNSIWNTVIFRDLSIWTLQERDICFEKSECEAWELWNKKFKKTQIAEIDPDNLTWWTESPITINDSFVRKYDEYWPHEVYIHLKSKYGIEVKKDYNINTSQNKDNARIAPWINMITIPATTFNNANPEIFLSKAMNNELVMYINNETWEECYVDIDIATDSDWDRETDNDKDILCNKMRKISYEPGYQAIWRLYFVNNWELTFKNFYVTFEWSILELDDENRALFNDISTLINWIEDLSIENTDLKKTLDQLRKNLGNRSEVTSLILSIKDQVEVWWIKIDLKQKDLLDSIVARLENEDTVISVKMNEYEKNKQEILALLATNKGNMIKSTVEEMFIEFEKNAYSYKIDEKKEEIMKIWDKIITDGKENNWLDNENDFTLYFCNILTYYNVSQDVKKCGSNISSITENYNKWKTETSSSSEWWFPLWLKIVLIILVWWLLTMWWIIVFFSIKAKLNSSSENDEEE